MDVTPPPSDEHELPAGVVPSHGIEINLPAATTPAHHEARPHPVKYMSAPAYQSPIRHRQRAPSRSKGVKETLNARSHYGSSEDDGAAIHRINQYNIKTEIGRGSFGAVHLAVDQYGNEFAVKEFSKSRLRKRAQSNLLRKPNYAKRPGPGHLAARMSFNSPLHRHSSSELDSEDNNSLNLIKEEIAIMKKLDHPNLVSLIEVLDDPDEDSLYMVLEMCKKGVVMKVGLEDRAEPYTDEACRCWFRDMILGIEYLHAQGIIHRDLKPDNCLITHDDVLKVVDFGVSEMFSKDSDMATTKSAGSPAFMPPELCVARHGQVSGRAADIWSMGVTLYCLRYGHVPFERPGILEMYESIRNEEVSLDEEKDPAFEDLIRRMLEKSPEKRITMEELREHPWVTKNGTDPLLSAEENCAVLIEPPTEIEMNHAITGNMGGVMVVMKAVKRFKELLARKRPSLMEGIFGRESRIVAPPHTVHGLSKSVETDNRRPIESALSVEGVHTDMDIDNEIRGAPAELDRLTVQSPVEGDAKPGAEQQPEADHHSDEVLESILSRPTTSDDHRGRFAHISKSRTFPIDDQAKGHAHDPTRDTLFLAIGASSDDNPSAHGFTGLNPDDPDQLYHVVSESPGGVEEDIYERAYQEEVARIIAQRGDQEPALHMNRRVDHIEDLRSHPNILASSMEHVRKPVGKLAGKLGMSAKGGFGFGKMVKEAQARAHGGGAESAGTEGGVLGGAIDDEDHVPTNESAVGGVDGPRAESGNKNEATHGECGDRAFPPPRKTPTAPAALDDPERTATPIPPGGFPASSEH